MAQYYQLEQSISVSRVVGWYLSFLLKVLIEHSVSKQWMPQNAESDLGLNSLPRLHKKDTRLIWRLPHPEACQSSLILNNARVFLTELYQSITEYLYTGPDTDQK